MLENRLTQYSRLYHKFNEDTRVKLPATLHFLKIGYSYVSLKTADIDFDTKIFVNRFKPALERINDKEIGSDELLLLLSELHALIRNNDLGRSFYKRLTDTTADIKLVPLKDWGRNFGNLKISTTSW